MTDIDPDGSDSDGDNIPCSISLFVETEHIKIMILMFKSKYMLIILV